MLGNVLTCGGCGGNLPVEEIPCTVDDGDGLPSYRCPECRDHRELMTAAHHHAAAVLAQPWRFQEPRR